MPMWQKMRGKVRKKRRREKIIIMAIEGGGQGITGSLTSGSTLAILLLFWFVVLWLVLHCIKKGWIKIEE